MSGDVHPNPGPATKYPCPVCTQNVTSRGLSYQCNRCSGWVYVKCSGLLNAAQYRRGNNRTCDPCSTPPPILSLPHTSSSDQTSNDSMFNGLQLNTNGIGNKLTELEVLMKNNKVKVTVIRESKLSSKSKSPCIQNYTTVRMDCPDRGALLIFIHRSVTLSKQPSSAETFHGSRNKEHEVDHFQHLHSYSQLLQQWVAIFNRPSYGETGHHYPW